VNRWELPLRNFYRQEIRRWVKKKRKLKLAIFVSKRNISGRGSDKNIHFVRFFLSCKMGAISSSRLKLPFTIDLSSPFLVSSFWLAGGMREIII
jgi:hypothetical protein